LSAVLFGVAFASPVFGQQNPGATNQVEKIDGFRDTPMLPDGKQHVLQKPVAVHKKTCSSIVETRFHHSGQMRSPQPPTLSPITDTSPVFWRLYSTCAV